MNINTSDGYIKLHRKIIGSDLWQDNNALVVFVNLLTFAHHDDNNGSVSLNGKQIYLKRGQLSISRHELARRCNMSPSTVRNALDRLQRDKRVVIQSDNRTSVISILNYCKYQGSGGQHKDNSRDNSGTTAGQPTSISEEIKNKEYNIPDKSGELVKLKNYFYKLVDTLGQTGNVMFLPKRKSKLVQRLRTFGQEKLLLAAQNIANDPYMTGDNPAGKRYGDIDYLLRDDVIVDKWLNHGTAGKQYKSLKEKLQAQQK